MIYKILEVKTGSLTNWTCVLTPHKCICTVISKKMSQVVDSNNGSKVQAFYDTDRKDNTNEDEETCYRWMWLIKTPKQRMWRVWASSDEWISDRELCIKEGLNVNMDTPWLSTTTLFIEVLQNGYVNWKRIR